MALRFPANFSSPPPGMNLSSPRSADFEIIPGVGPGKRWPSLPSSSFLPPPYSSAPPPGMNLSSPRSSDFEIIPGVGPDRRWPSQPSSSSSCLPPPSSSPPTGMNLSSPRSSDFEIIQGVGPDRRCPLPPSPSSFMPPPSSSSSPPHTSPAESSLFYTPPLRYGPLPIGEVIGSLSHEQLKRVLFEAIHRHGDVSDILRRFQDTKRRKVYYHGLGWYDSSEEAAFLMAFQCGEIEEFKVVSDFRSKKMTACVLFNSVLGADLFIRKTPGSHLGTESCPDCVEF